MRMMQIAVFAGSLLGLVMIRPAVSNAADLDGRLGGREVSVRTHSVRTVVVADGCGWRCRAGCPDRYSCYPLYGAYGPYGGPAYWARYSIGGWGYR
jgi:hypothetical protein